MCETSHNIGWDEVRFISKEISWAEPEYMNIRARIMLQKKLRKNFSE